MKESIDRRDFIRMGALAGAGTVLAQMTGCNSLTPGGPKNVRTMMGVGSQPKDLIKVGYVGIGHQGSSHVRNLLKIEGCQLAAVCDIRPERTDWASKETVKAGQPEPKVYTGDDYAFIRMCQEEDLDLVYNAAPWRWHAPICLAAMKNGKHAASEVNIALSVDECWELVETSEKTAKHCILMENCCYDPTEMLVMNMIRKGLFGEIMYGECGYLHDLRALKLSPDFYQGMWRLMQSVKRNGNLYPTHGIGPMAWCMDINRGDALDTIVSMSTKSLGLNEYAKEHYPESEWVNTKFALGDVNICLIKTKKGKVIICKHDTNLPRPYSRDFVVQGTKGLMHKYPIQQIHIEGLSPAHNWEDLSKYQEEFEHPVWKSLKEKAQGATHGGMDYVEDYRLIQALRQGIAPDIDVYDSVIWSVIIPLSEESVRLGGKPVKFPDFTRGAWQQPRELGIVTHLY